MLTCKVGQSFINILDTNYDKFTLKKWSNKGLLKCPVCNEEYRYCHGDVNTPYFRHKSKECEGYYYEKETDEHRNGKVFIYNWLKNQPNISNLKLEYWIPETKQRPDIYFEQDNQRYVIEFQCSPISTEYLQRRELYRLNGINDIWILGVSKYNFSKNILLISRTIEKELLNKNNLIYLDADKELLYLQPDHNCFVQNGIKLRKITKEFSTDFEELKEYQSSFLTNRMKIVNFNELTFNHSVTLTLPYQNHLLNLISVIDYQTNLQNEKEEREFMQLLVKNKLKETKFHRLYQSLEYKQLLTIGKRKSNNYDFMLNLDNEFYFFVKSNEINFCMTKRINKKYTKFITIKSLEISSIYDKKIKSFINECIPKYYKGRLNEEK